MISDALRTVGAARSIVIDEDNLILAGNGVTEAAAEAGITRLRVVEADGNELIAVRRTGLTAEQKRALAIYDNRTAELAEWNWDQLQADKAAGLSLQPFWSEAEEKTLLAQHGVKAGHTDPDAVPAERATDIQRGDLFQLGAHRLLCGDATVQSDVARLMGTSRADLCFTSPPYNLGKSVGLRNGVFRGAETAYTGSSMDSDEPGWATLMDGFTDHALKVSRYLAVNVQMLAGNKRALVSWLGGLADYLVDVLVWVKANPPPAMAEHVANSAFEFVVVLSADSNPSRAINSASFSRGSFSNVYQSSVGSNSHTEGQHGATFPVEFAAHYIGNLSYPDALLYDPFSGSGTTLIAAEQSARRCFGLELQPSYCQVIIDRWEAFTQQHAVKLASAVAV